MHKIGRVGENETAEARNGERDASNLSPTPIGTSKQLGIRYMRGSLCLYPVRPIDLIEPPIHLRLRDTLSAKTTDRDDRTIVSVRLDAPYRRFRGEYANRRDRQKPSPLKGKRDLVGQFRQVVDIGTKYPAREERTKSPADLGPGGKVWVKSKRRDLGCIDCGSEGMNELVLDS